MHSFSPFEIAAWNSTYCYVESKMFQHYGGSFCHHRQGATTCVDAQLRNDFRYFNVNCCAINKYTFTIAIGNRRMCLCVMQSLALIFYIYSKQETQPKGFILQPCADVSALNLTCHKNVKNIYLQTRSIENNSSPFSPARR
jgi:hypothetical protein